MTFHPDSINVLHVDDDASVTELTATYLEREDERLSVETATDATAAIERLRSRSFDCLVSDYDMPGTNGLDLLDAVRAEFDDLPFILFTGKGSEAIASDAISAGVTDYLQKETGTDQYTVLANRIVNAASDYHRKQKLREHRTAVEAAGDAMYALDRRGHFRMANSEFVETFGHTRDELLGSHVRDYLSVETVQGGTESILQLLNDDQARIASYVFEEPDADGERRTYENTISLIGDSGQVDGSVGVVRDITDQRRRMRYIERQNEQLEEFTTLVSQDLQDPLQRADAQLAEARASGDLGYLHAIDTSLTQVQEIAATLERLSAGDTPLGSDAVDIAGVARDAWDDVATESAELTVDVSASLWADEDRLRTMFEHLFRGVVGRRTGRDDLPEGSASAFAPGATTPLDDWDPLTDTVRIGPLEQIHTATRAMDTDVYGFYVADDDLEQVSDLESAFSGNAGPSPGRVGPWLTTVKEVAIGHGWEIYVTASKAGGCRIEFAGITPQ